ncbi:hypothetical protein BH09SUM1_BH09SUM1_29310 [soil metagenome]
MNDNGNNGEPTRLLAMFIMGVSTGVMVTLLVIEILPRLH